jgi:succinate dehydrogenase flavin-adding protein (antitoxin of CptAB toxin-antitoxin module)
MRKQIKFDNSPIMKNDWQYPKNRTEISGQLLAEQKNLCAYTETYLGRTDKKEIEHFNPMLKKTDKDSYQNWFLVKAQWNNEKGSTKRWLEHQGLFHPTDETFEKRIIYLEGEYICHPDDIEADNLIKFLKLNDEELTTERKAYIARRRESIEKQETNAQTYFDELYQKEPNRVYFIRAIEEEFSIKIAFTN